MLETAGYIVKTASDGEEALAKSQEQSYDIAFVDLQMPKMGGLELLRSLHGMAAKTAVVILTTYGSVAHAVEAMKLGAVDFLEKPFDPKTIRLLTEEILLRQSLGSSGSVESLLHLAELANVEPIPQVLAETFSIGCREHAHLRVAGFVLTHALELSILEEAQELCL